MLVLPDVCPADDPKKKFNVLERKSDFFFLMFKTLPYKGWKGLKAACFLMTSRGRYCPDEFVVSVFSFKSY